MGKHLEGLNRIVDILHGNEALTIPEWAAINETMDIINMAVKVYIPLDSKDFLKPIPEEERAKAMQDYLRMLESGNLSRLIPLRYQRENLVIEGLDSILMVSSIGENSFQVAVGRYDKEMPENYTLILGTAGLSISNVERPLINASPDIYAIQQNSEINLIGLNNPEAIKECTINIGAAVYSYVMGMINISKNIMIPCSDSALRYIYKQNGPFVDYPLESLRKPTDSMIIPYGKNLVPDDFGSFRAGNYTVIFCIPQEKPEIH